MQAVRFGDWKAIRLWDNKANAMGEVTLYDLSKDPSEERNLAKRNPELVERALRLLKTARVNDPEYPLTKRKNLNNL